MFCHQCGNQISPGARFCSSCGAAVTSAAANVYAPSQSRLYRSRNDRMVAGVCGGLALHYGWDLTVVRLVLVLCIIFGGTGLLAYVIAWIVIPEAPYDLAAGFTGNTAPPVV